MGDLDYLSIDEYLKSIKGEEVYEPAEVTRMIKELRTEIKLIRYTLERFNERLDKLDKRIEALEKYFDEPA